MTLLSRPGPLAAWIMAARPKTLPASTAGVIVGSALAYGAGRFELLPALAALVVASALQIASNIANDVFDFERGSDSIRALGPTRVTQAGLISPGAMKAGLAVAIGVAALAGLALAWHAATIAPGSWPWLLGVGFLAILSAVAYTAGPFPLAYLGLGDLFVLLFFGLAAVAGTWFTQTGALAPAPFLLALGPGLIIVNILVVNNLRDVEEDRQVGKRTLVVRFGKGFGKAEYLVCMAGAYAVLPLAIGLGLVPAWTMLAWLSAPLAVANASSVLRKEGQALNATLAGTGQTSFVWAALFAVGMFIAGGRA